MMSTFTLKKALAGAIVGGVALIASSAAFALPAVQLGPGSGNWGYDAGTQTWVTDDNPFSLMAYANATKANGGDGKYAWEAAGAGTQTAYLVVAAMPQINFDGFDVTVTGDGGALTLVASGVGAAPISDPNSLAPHAIYDTYFEIYAFQFNGAIVDIADTQPGQTGTGKGYAEEISILINSLAAGVTGIHMDLFTLVGDGILDGQMDLVNAFAPFSHDAQTGTPPPPPPRISEPGMLATFGMGLLLLGFARRRKLFG